MDSSDTSDQLTSTDNLKRVIVLIRGLGRGGAERLVVEEAQYLKACGHEVEVWFQVAGEFCAELEASGIPTRRLSNFSLLQRTFRNRKGLAIFHSHSPRLTAIVSLAIWRSPKVLLIHTEHNMLSIYHPLTRAFHRWAIRRVDKLIAVSRAVAASCPDPERAKVLSHFRIDSPRMMQCLSMSRATDPNRFKVLCIASLTEKKNHKALLAAIEEVHRQISLDIEVDLLGDGPLRGMIQQVAAEIERPGLKINIWGERNDVPEMLSSADVLVLPSLSEGLPLVVIEAMAAGTPVIATAVGGVPELIVDGVNGLLIEPGGNQMLADAIERIAQDQGLGQRLSEAGRKWVGSQKGMDWRGHYRSLFISHF